MSQTVWAFEIYNGTRLQSHLKDLHV